MHTILVICASDTATIELPPQPYPLAAGSCSGGPWAHYLYYTIDPGLYYLWYAARSVKLKAPPDLLYFTLSRSSRFNSGHHPFLPFTLISCR